MSYPGRPPIMQGLPMPYMSMGGPAPPLIPAVMPLQHMVPIQVTSAPQIRAYPKLNPNREQQKQVQGPAVTVFVGNITERAPDAMIRQILAACGHVISWKKVKAFGFCELAGPDAGLRAVRILHDLMVGDKRLVAKVDAKTKTVLDEYKAERRKRLKGTTSPLQDEPEEEELDEETQALDAVALERIKQIIIEYQEEMNNFELKKEEEVIEKWNKVLEEAEVEEEKRDLITREIGKFREIMKANGNGAVPPRFGPWRRWSDILAAMAQVGLESTRLYNHNVLTNFIQTYSQNDNSSDHTSTITVPLL